jgi:hypothetical protein
MLEQVRDPQRRAAIAAEIAGLGPVVPGTISERSTRCGGAGCHCRADPPVLHGPYATWTHQEEGRQVTKTLSPDEAEALRPSIESNRRLHQLVKELEAISIAEFEAGVSS